MKQKKMKQFGKILLLGLILALVTSCSKDEVEPVDNSEPVIPLTSQEMTGEFEGEWSYTYGHSQNGKIVVNDRYIFIDELLTDIIVLQLVDDIRDYCLDHPEVEAQMKDSIGNFFFASSYKFPATDLQIKYNLVSYSDGSYSASILSMKNMWSDIITTIIIDKEPPYPSETIVIAQPEPNTISFGVKADDVSYRIDLISKEHETTAELNMSTGLCVFQYWFNIIRINNLQTGQQYDAVIMNDGYPRRHNKEDTNLLQFQAKKRIGTAVERIVAY